MLLFLIMLSFSISAQYTTETYKTLPTGPLKINIFSSKSELNRTVAGYPAIVLFFGGGWKIGDIGSLAKQADYLSKRGMVAICVEYRTESLYCVTPFDCVADAKSAMRYVRANATRLGIDSSRIAAGGASAGGQLAAATALVTDYNDPLDNLAVSSKANALMLFNPVIDNGPGGYGYDRIRNEYPKFSPIHNIRVGAPPTLILIGTSDKLIPVATVESYKQKMEAVGSRCDLILYPGVDHGFYKAAPYFQQTLQEADKFFISLGYLSIEPVVTI